MNWHERSKEEGFRIRHFFRDSHLVATLVADAKAEGETVQYGLSVVCPKDSPNKELGRQIAHGRWIKAKADNAPLSYSNEIKLSIPLYGTLNGNGKITAKDCIIELIKVIREHIENN